MKSIITKQRIAHEVSEFLIVLLFVAPFVLAIASYRLYLRPFEGAVFAYTTALINAFAISKIIITEDLVKLGKSSENKPLIVPTLHKSAALTLLYLAFRGLETAVHSLLHGQSFLAALQEAFVTEKGEFLILGLVTFFAAVPGLALRELRRVMGADTFLRLFFGS